MPEDLIFTYCAPIHYSLAQTSMVIFGGHPWRHYNSLSASRFVFFIFFYKKFFSTQHLSRIDDSKLTICVTSCVTQVTYFYRTAYRPICKGICDVSVYFTLIITADTNRGLQRIIVKVWAAHNAHSQTEENLVRNRAWICTRICPYMLPNRIYYMHSHLI